MTAALEFTASDWERTERNWTAWWRGEIERPMIVLEAMADPKYRLETWVEHLTQYPLDTPAERIIDGSRTNWRNGGYLATRFRSGSPTSDRGWSRRSSARRSTRRPEPPGSIRAG